MGKASQIPGTDSVLQRCRDEALPAALHGTQLLQLGRRASQELDLQASHPALGPAVLHAGGVVLTASPAEGSLQPALLPACLPACLLA